MRGPPAQDRTTTRRWNAILRTICPATSASAVVLPGAVEALSFRAFEKLRKKEQLTLRSALALGISGVVVAAVIWAWSTRHAGSQQESSGSQVPVGDRVQALLGVGLQYVLTPERCAALGGPPGDEFDVEPNQAVVVGNANGLLEITTSNDGIQAERLADKPPDSFSLDGQGSILSVSGQYFGQLENGAFSKAVPLPYAGMRLMGSSLAGVTYLIRGNASGPYRVYAYFADGTLQIEAEV